MVVGALLTNVPAVKAIGLICVGISVAGSCIGVSAPPLESLPGDAVISRAPHIGQVISEHETLEG